MITIKEILRFLEEENFHFIFTGDQNRMVDGFSSLSNLKRHSITWVKKLENFDSCIGNTALDLLIVTPFWTEDTVPVSYNIIQCNDPKAVFFCVLNHYWAQPRSSGIAPTSTVETDRIGKNVSIGHNCYIGKDVCIGDDATIENNVVIQNHVVIGDNVIIRSGAVIGVDGFGFYKAEDDTNMRVVHFGGVEIGNDVEIGAGCCISRGTIDNTVIRDNVKLDSLCHVGHNAFIGEKSMLTAMTMLAGSCKLVKNVYTGPNSLIMNQITVGEDSYLGLGAVATKDVPANKVVAGIPAKVLRDNYSDR